MGRYTKANCRLCRRVGDKLMLKGDRCSTSKCAVERRDVPPGYTGIRKRRAKKSDRGLQLQEKQKARYSYGLLERQFRKFFAEAERLPGITGENLLILLERRLDNAVYRLGFASSRSQARQLVCHGHFLLNGRKTDIPSCLVKPGDAIAWRETSTKSEYYKLLVQEIEGRNVPGWLALDKEKLAGRIVNLPTAEDIEVKFDEKAIVEYYSR
ncbi:MAG: 30S ribosomal protein S4 [Chloroflexi bacterium]|nr:30S ribosomal protein S4 [Chloroflexota bacterium]MBL7061724.1 30S ribosomal protein S4 [Dehalococcoidia bacterium]